MATSFVLDLPLLIALQPTFTNICYNHLFFVIINRDNAHLPGGLLTSAVDVSTLFVPNGSDIVSARGRGFPETLYRSKTDPILNPSTKLAVLVNEQTASAAEIVTGKFSFSFGSIPLSSLSSFLQNSYSHYLTNVHNLYL